jgi:hypothetical protein
MFVVLQENQAQQVLVPDLQSTITFHDKPLIAVRLTSGDHGVVLRWICENLHLDVTAQIQRIKRTEATSDERKSLSTSAMRLMLFIVGHNPSG